jgi:crotonobetainyl-CoA:carnitine CoA-transferase CaiB-like acyl-CoA transferase
MDEVRINEKMPMKGLKVIDLADEKGSFCSRLLADMGAEVIRVERPEDDRSRNIGPFWNASLSTRRSIFYFYNNVNKLGITLDFKKRGDLSILKRWMESADVVVETFPPGYLKDLGMDFEEMSKKNPGLIMVSITGFGQTGPYSNYKSSDIVACASGGQMYVTGLPSKPPLRLYGEQSFYIASLFSAIGVLLAIRRRLQTGRGDHIDISLQEVWVSSLDHVMVRYFYEGVIPERMGGTHWNGSFSIFPCRDGHILISLFSGWETIVELMATEGMEEDLLDERWKDDGFRLKNLDHVIETIGRWTGIHSKWELFELGQLLRLPWAPVLSPLEVIKSPQLNERGFFIEIEGAKNGQLIHFPGHPFRFTHIKLFKWKRAPYPGEDNYLCHKEYPWATGVSNHYFPDRVSANESDMEILKGIRIVDFTWLLAGPYATRILADFGAEVIKIQSKKTSRGGESNLTGYFNHYNRNKKGITLDMNHQEAREIFLRLVSISDIVVENFSPRVMKNWGLNYERLKEVNPQIIMLSMSAMGQTGPWKDFVALGPTIHALTGLTYLTSFSENVPLGPGFSYADIVSALYGTFSILIALEYRRITGKGNYIDLSEYEAMCALLGPTFIDLLSNGKEARPFGNRSPHFPAGHEGCYRCAGNNRWCVINIFDDDQWNRLCRAMGKLELLQDCRFSNPSKRMQNSDELEREIEEWSLKHDPDDIVKILQKEGIPAGIVQNARDLFKDPHLQSRGFFISIDHPILGNNFTETSPIRFSHYKFHKWKGAPILGEDNRYVYIDLLGLKEDELLSLMKKEVIS